jgi:hypothetical protein
MSLESRVEKLEQQTGVGFTCPVCDAPPREDEKGNYDESVWRVGKTHEMNIACVHCGRPRRIILNLIERREEAKDEHNTEN